MASQADTSIEDHWRQELLESLLALSPAGFEVLCQRLLMAAGLVEVVVTGRPGDEGIDIRGILPMVGLISFPVVFQCKCLRRSVTASMLRDFRGAMAGRADKGVFITTGNFTVQAIVEANRDGVPYDRPYRRGCLG